MNNDLRTYAMRILYKYGVEDDGSLTETYKELKALFRTATLDEVKEAIAIEFTPNEYETKPR